MPTRTNVTGLIIPQAVGPLLVRSQQPYRDLLVAPCQNAQNLCCRRRQFLKSYTLRLGTSWEQQASRRILGHSINRESRLQEGERLSDSPVKRANFFGYGSLGNRGGKN